MVRGEMKMRVVGYSVYRKVFDENGKQVAPYTRILVRKTTKKRAIEYIKNAERQGIKDLLIGEVIDLFRK